MTIAVGEVSYPLPVYILAGGKSRRFGSDKARAEFDGLPLLTRLARAAAPVAASITVVADRQDRYADLDLRTIADRIPERGPLGGLHTATEDAKADSWILALTCDLVAFDPGWVVPLFAVARVPILAAAYRDEGWQPFPGLYHTALRTELERRIAEGLLGMRHLLDTIPSATTGLPSDWPRRLQVNTPADLALVSTERHRERS